ncbi:cro/C1 family transcription regulator [Halobacterium hubeiense]|jgi:ribosome-binding protein aMBF1 (putative translation factor)|uniref:Cro/C1 family transcription regulator n=2 Tax=Halobacterium TaxID=2239 RepID=A0A0U5H4D3_9EURY|nr:multiprotein-bridging factor 1 family protein [Halobacterium hubeiense]CQH58721.1 cro/C1 family transcription regulator [Halobacterium hubeiense]
MPKYSTGGASGGGGGQTCELCGSTSDSLRSADVAGAELTVCPDCASSHDESPDRTPDEDQQRKQEAAQNTARALDQATGDSSHWEENGTDYERDQLPYLVTDYGERVVRARQEAGLQREELAEELGVDESDLLAVEQGRATQASVGGSVVAALEDRLDVELSDE